jgi:hypothetical protein
VATYASDFGECSRGLAAIDIDTDEGVGMFLALNPRFHETFQRKGANGSQFFIYPEGDYPREKATYANSGEDHWGEWRVGGRGKCSESVIFGEHEIPGIFYRWIVDKPPIRILWEEILWPEEWKLPCREKEQAKAKADWSEWARKRVSWELPDYDYKGLLTYRSIPFIIAVDAEQPNMVKFPCPRKELHTNPSADTDMTIWAKPGAIPTCFCLHTSCGMGSFKDFLEWADRQEPGCVAKFCKVQRVSIELPHRGRLGRLFTDQLGDILREHNFYDCNGVVSTLRYNDKLGIEELTVMTNQSFRTAIEDYCTPYFRGKEKTDKGIKETMFYPNTISDDIAKMTLASPQFIKRLKLISGVNYTRLPVLREDGTIDLLPEGYDAESQILTLVKDDSVYEIDWTQARAVAFLCGLLSEFCFTEADREHDISVSLAAMLTLYCRHVLNEDNCRPNFLWNANAEGAGKTLGAKLAIVPTLGYCPTGSLPAEEAEIRKNITTAVMATSPVLFYDNVKRHIRSGALEALTTSPVYRDRVLGANREINCFHGLTLFITGNGCTFTPDFRRRTLVVDLFLQHVRAEDRVIQNPLDDAKLLELRPQILAAMCALVRSWYKAGMPKPQSVQQNFLEWSLTINGILEHSHFMKLCETSSDASVGGDRDLLDMETLTKAMKPKYQYNFEQLEKLIKDNGLFEKIYQKEDNSPLSSDAANSAIGKFLRRFDKRILGRRSFYILDNKNRSRKKFVVEEV